MEARSESVAELSDRVSEVTDTPSVGHTSSAEQSQEPQKAPLTSGSPCLVSSASIAGAGSSAAGGQRNDKEPTAPPRFREPDLPAKRAVTAPPTFDAAPKASTSHPTDAATRKGTQARSAALAAAAAAAAYSLPAQRERAVAEAAAAAYAQQQAAEQAAEAAQAKPEGGEAAAGKLAKEPSTYSPPAWAGRPEGVQYSLEVMKAGAIVEQREVAEKDHYTFGRAPTPDFVLEHPSASRLHAVLQYSGSTREAFIYDCGSSHGTFLNKRRLKPQVHVPFRVGDMVKFGQSSRVYILTGPTDLMPQEGLNRKQRHEQATLKAQESRREREAQVSKAQMEIALSRGVSWGLSEDAEVDDADLDADNVDWRAYSETHTLTDKQAKLVEKVRKREVRIRNLNKELEAIRAKQVKYEELSAGQAATMARNEHAIDKATEEMDDLEEMLKESIADSISGRRRAAEGKGDDPAKKQMQKKRQRTDEDEEDGAGSSDSDVFYDRTATTTGSRKKQETSGAEDAASLFGRKEALQAEQRRLEEAIRSEELLLAEMNGHTHDAAPPAEPGATEAAPAADAGAAEGAPAQADAEGVDALDAFMSNMETQIELDKVGTYQKELREVTEKLAEVERLMKIADPDGFFKAGSAAAQAAGRKAAKTLQLERQRKEAAERQRQEKLAAKAAEEEAAAHFMPEEEETEAQPAEIPAEPAALSTAEAAAASVHRMEADLGAGPSGLQVRQRPVSFAPSQQQALPAEDRAAGGASSAHQPADKSGFLSRKQLAAKAQGANKPDASAKVLADLAMLSQAKRGVQEGEQQQHEQVDTKFDWKPPENQTGDGKTALNARLGY